MLIGKHVWCNNVVQIVENQLTDNDKQQKCANMEILTKVFCYMCNTLSKINMKCARFPITISNRASSFNMKMPLHMIIQNNLM